MNSPLDRRSISWRLQISGFTLLEFLIALAVFGTVIGAVFASLTKGQTLSAISKEETEMQQNLQDVLTLMTSEIRTAGFPPETFYDAEYLQSCPTCKNLVAQGLVEIGPQNIKFQGDIDTDGKVDFIHYYRVGSSVPYVLNRFGGQINPNGSLPGGPPQKLSEQIESLQFKYFNPSGEETSNLEDVATIEIRLTLQTKKVDPLSGVYRTVSQSTRVRPPNL